ncbi:unnamed protein product [Closterium sp. NIES-54]
MPFFPSSFCLSRSVSSSSYSYSSSSSSPDMHSFSWVRTCAIALPTPKAIAAASHATRHTAATASAPSAPAGAAAAAAHFFGSHTRSREIAQLQEDAPAGASIADAGPGEAVAGAAASAATAARPGVEGREGVAITVLVVDDDDDCQIVSPPVRHTGHEARASHEARAQHERRVASRTRETRAAVRVSGEARVTTWGENEQRHNDPMHRQVVDLEEEAGAEGGGGVAEQVADSPEVVLVRGGGASRGLQGAVSRHRSRGADGAAGAGRQRRWSSTSTGGAAAMGSAAVRSAAVSTATHRGMLRVPVSVQGGALRGGGGVGGSGRRRVEEPGPDEREAQALVVGAVVGGGGNGGMERGGRAGGGMHLVCSVCLDDMSEETVTPCGHVFCRGCITMAIRETRQCPMCRKTMHLRQIRPIFLRSAMR